MAGDTLGFQAAQLLNSPKRDLVWWRCLQTYAKKWSDPCRTVAAPHTNLRNGRLAGSSKS